MSAPFRPPKTFGRAVRRHGQVFADRGGWGLADLMRNTLDPAYQAAADRRSAAATGARPSRLREIALVVVGLLVVGLLVAVAYRENTRGVPDRTKAREALIEQIDHTRTDVTDLAQTAGALRSEVNELQESALSASEHGQALLTEVAALELASAQNEVTGPGIVLRIGNPPPGTGSDPIGGTPGGAAEALISDRDLARAVNALWLSGAEAIALNGHRIGPATPIRQAGGAILVDFLPVSSPYVLEVIGPVATIGADFATTTIGRRFATYRSAYNATFSIDNAATLTLPAGHQPTLSYATAAD